MKQAFIEQAKIMRQPVILLEGTRKVPEEHAQRLHALANFLAASLPDAVFRSGNAQGADTFFFQGLVAANPERLEYILPVQMENRERALTYTHKRYIRLCNGR